MRATRVVAGSALGVALLLAALPRPAFACSCVFRSPATLARAADLVFVGVSVARHDPGFGAPVVSSADTIVWRFDVERVLKGDARDGVEVGAARNGASCGYEFEPGRRHLVFAARDGDTLSTGLCQGTRALAAGELVDIGPDRALWVGSAAIALVALAGAALVVALRRARAVAPIP